MKFGYTMLLLVGLGLSAGMENAFGAPKSGVSASLNVKAELDKDRTVTQAKKKIPKTKTISEVYELDIQVVNTSKQEAEFKLEWYFINCELDNRGYKGDPVTGEKGAITFTLGGHQRKGHEVKPKPLSCTELFTKKGKTFKGKVFAGYIVLLRHEGEILKKDSNKNLFLTDANLRSITSK